MDKSSCLENKSIFDELLKGILAGRDKELGKAITLIENRDKLANKILKKLYGEFNPAYLIGITGPPGAGKSSLIDHLTAGWLEENKKIAVIAVDPSSQISGGAFLGDRIRMKRISNHKNVFIRSMATRGSTGGLNPAVYDTVLLLSAAGFDMIVIETVGVGQTEIDIVRLADTSVVVAVPEAGDEIQIFKSDLMDVGDIFVLNKADLPGSARMEIMIKQLFNLKAKSNNNLDESWKPQLIKTSTYEEYGIAELRNKIAEHHLFLEENGLIELKQSLVIEKQLIYLLEEKIYIDLIGEIKNSSKYKKLLDNIIKGIITPHQAVAELIREKLK
ncbi:MAG: methylmalonyl Co-A mutase-associated GTPase MeaB [Halanaerobium sp.]